MSKIEMSAKSVPNTTFWHVEKIFRYAPIHVSNWMSANQKHYPQLLFWGGAIAVGIVCACIALSLVSQAAGALAVSVVMQTGAGIAVVFTLVVFTVMAVGTHNALKYRALNAPPETANALPAGDTWQPPSISPDIIVCLLPGEDVQTFKKRAADIRNCADITHAIWAAIVPPYVDGCLILTGDRKQLFGFSRGNEPWRESKADWCGTMDFTNEDITTYRRYVENFAYEYRKWATPSKMELNPDRAENIFIETI